MAGIISDTGEIIKPMSILPSIASPTLSVPPVSLPAVSRPVFDPAIHDQWMHAMPPLPTIAPPAVPVGAVAPVLTPLAMSTTNVAPAAGYPFDIHNTTVVTPKKNFGHYVALAAAAHTLQNQRDLRMGAKPSR
jgi:hypothetical protein